MIFQIHPASHLLIYLFICSFDHTYMAYRNLVLQPGIKPGPLAERAQSLNHWSAKEFPPFINLSHQSIISGLCLISPIVLLFKKKKAKQQKIFFFLQQKIFIVNTRIPTTKILP